MSATIHCGEVATAVGGDGRTHERMLGGQVSPAGRLRECVPAAVSCLKNNARALAGEDVSTRTFVYAEAMPVNDIASAATAAI